MTPEPTASGWFAVRCLFRSGWPPPEKPGRSHRYEERITLWRAATLDEAIERAEADAEKYATTLEDSPDEYLGLAQAFALFGAPDHDGAEVYSLFRSSDLDPETYLDSFFDTGREHRRHITSDSEPGYRSHT